MMQQGGRGMELGKWNTKGHKPAYVVMRDILTKSWKMYMNEQWVIPFYSNLFYFMEQDDQGRYLFDDRAFQYMVREIRNLLRYRNYMYVVNLRTLGRAVYMQEKYRWMWKRAVLEAQMLHDINASIAELNSEMSGGLTKLALESTTSEALTEIKRAKKEKHRRLQMKKAMYAQEVKKLAKESHNAEAEARILIDFTNKTYGKDSDVSNR